LPRSRATRRCRPGDREKALALAEQKVLPHIDFAEATKLAVGKAWATATPEQQQKLVGAFRSMLVRIYSNAIDAYRGQTMRVQPASTRPGSTDVTVRNQYIRPGQTPIAVDYAMHKTPEGWKIYDITVEGNEPRAHIPRRVRSGDAPGGRRGAAEAPRREELAADAAQRLVLRFPAKGASPGVGTAR
jgi:phospholipid transport system substrate-binding protein